MLKKVEWFLRTARKKAAQVPDGITPKIISNLGPSSWSPLHFFNETWERRELPSWKEAALAIESQ